jgi:hypothetical protein
MEIPVSPRAAMQALRQDKVLQAAAPLDVDQGGRKARF